MSKLLKGVEEHYNHARTLQVAFTETYTSQGRKRTESGDLYLRKPGRMRWQYAQPSGKLFVSDGKYVYLYSPDTNRAQKMPLKSTEDMRAPMAFLLGKLEFQKDFKDFKTKPVNDATFVTATPKSDKMPYTEVSFQVDRDARIQRLIVTGQDQSILEFDFATEKMNPPINDDLFHFELPKGAEFVDTSASQGGN